MTREQLQTRLAQNIEMLCQLRDQHELIESQILSISLTNDEIRTELKSFKAELRVVA